MEQVRMAPLDAASFVVGKTHPVLRRFRSSRRFAIMLVAMALFDLPMRGSWALLLLALVAVSGRRAGLGLFDLEHRRDPAGGVSARAAGVVSADADAVRVHLSDREHAGGAARRSPTSCRRAISSIALRGIVLKGAGLADVLAAARGARRLRRRRCWRWRRCGCAGSGADMRRIGFLIWKELIELRQDPRLFGIVIVAPIIQLFMLGYAATTDVRDVPIVVADADRSPRAASWSPVRRVAELHHRRRRRPSTERDRPVSRTRRRRGWRWRFRPATARRSRQAAGRRRCRSSPTAATRTRPTCRSAMRRNLIAGYAQELAAAARRAGRGRAPAAASSRASASGSTRGSRAATS